MEHILMILPLMLVGGFVLFLYRRKKDQKKESGGSANDVNPDNNITNRQK